MRRNSFIIPGLVVLAVVVVVAWAARSPVGRSLQPPPSYQSNRGKVSIFSRSDYELLYEVEGKNKGDELGTQISIISHDVQDGHSFVFMTNRNLDDYVVGYVEIIVPLSLDNTFYSGTLSSIFIKENLDFY